MNKLSILLVLVAVSLSSATFLNKESKVEVDSGLTAKLLNVTLVGPNVNGSMISYATGQVLTSANNFNLTTATCFKTSNAVKNSMEKKYGGQWAVDCIQQNMGKDYYTYVNGFNIHMLISSNAVNFFFLIYQQNTLAPTTAAVRPEISSVGNDESEWKQFGAYLVKAYYVGNGVNADMQNNLINFAVTAAGNFDLGLTPNGACFHCLETAQSISLNINFAYRSNWQTEVLVRPSTGEYGSASLNVQKGQALALIVNSNSN
jgi:hypothetical protein